MNYTFLLSVLLVGVTIYVIDCNESMEDFTKAYSFSSDDVGDLLGQKRLKRNLLFNHHHHHQNQKNVKIITTTWKYIPADDVDKKKATDENLKTRKVWSRWGKWGECSVTCGEGTISRKRVCVLGRCAPGEMEEQRHPCTRAPCLQFDVEERREQD